MAHVGIKRTITATALVIRLTGELDYAGADQAASRLEQAAAVSPPPGLVIVDLTRISYLSAAGLRAVQRFTAACSGCSAPCRPIRGSRSSAPSPRRCGPAASERARSHRFPACKGFVFRVARG